MPHQPHDVSDELRRAVRDRVRADLEPARAVVHAKLGGGVLIGGLVSLFLCGQLGVGLSGAATATHHFIMQHTGMLGCAIICGILFAIVPVLVLRATCSPLQFRVMIRNELRTLVGWIAAFGSTLALGSELANPVWELTAWGVAAIASFWLLARALDALTRVAAPRA